jgi:threonine/homoserine/homoserine lactone efflux protein
MSATESILSVLLVALMLVSCTWFFHCLCYQLAHSPRAGRRHESSVVDRWLMLVLGLVLGVTVIAVAAMLLQ